MQRTATVAVNGVTVLDATARAIYVHLPDNRNIWVPNSVVDDASPCWRVGDAGTLVVQQWWWQKANGAERWRPLRVWKGTTK